MLWHGSRVDSDLLTMGFYRERIEELEAANPQWFVNDDREEDWEKPATDPQWLANDGQDEDWEKPTPDPVAQLRQEIHSLITTMVEQRRRGIWIVGALVIGIIIGVVIR